MMEPRQSSLVSPDRVKDQFESFLRDYQDGVYLHSLGELVEKVKFETQETVCIRLDIDMGDLRLFDSELTQSVLTLPTEILPLLFAAVKSTLAKNQRTAFMELEKRKIPCRVGFRGSFGNHQVSPRELTSDFLGKLVSVEGIIIKLSPRLLSEDKENLARRNAANENNQNNTEKQDEPEFGDFHDMRAAILQERPDAAPSGQLPRSVALMLTHDLVNKARPGDSVIITGVFSSYPRPTLKALSVRPFSREKKQINVTSDDKMEFRKVANEGNVLSRFSKSVAPNVIAPELLKQGLLLQLLGGCARNLSSGARLRGDIHCLLIGDPSVAKSQLLRSILRICPLGISASGRGSSAAGLTAAVITDRLTRERKLEAGAMVLADRGIVCVDEFDKMSDKDRVALHEAMEQQTVTIAKAGLHATLNARCSVLAAANPLFGRYNRNLSVHRNLSLPDSLLSRFDLLFVMLDDPETKKDRDLAEHILKLHRLIPPAAAVDIELMRKYIFFARHSFNPVLTAEASKLISTEYANLRADLRPKTLPVTPRLLETLIRLSTANAKLNLRDEVLAEDCRATFRIVRFSLFRTEDDYEMMYGAEEDSLEGCNAPLPMPRTAEATFDEEQKMEDFDDNDEGEIEIEESRLEFFRKHVTALESSGKVSVSLDTITEIMNSDLREKNRVIDGDNKLRFFSMKEVRYLAMYCTEEEMIMLEGDDITF